MYQLCFPCPEGEKEINLIEGIFLSHFLPVACDLLHVFILVFAKTSLQFSNWLNLSELCPASSLPPMLQDWLKQLYSLAFSVLTVISHIF